MENNWMCSGIVLLLVAIYIPTAWSNQMAFPGATWEQASPESQGIDSAKLKAAVDYLRDHSGSNGVKRLIIVRNGRVIWKGSQADRPQRVWSVTKAFTSTAHGLLIKDRKCMLDTPALKYNPKDLAEHYPDVTLRHFATMTSGYDGVGGSYDYDEKRRGDQNALVGPLPPFFAPGTRYQYWDEATQQYGYVLTQIAGESLYEYLKRRIFNPIGITKTDWSQDSTGKVLNWTGGLVISASDLARFGHLYLNEGNWAGKQLVPASWVREATRVQVPPSIPNALASSGRKGSGVYGYHWWPNGITPEGKRRWPDAPLCTYSRSGYNNNDLFIIPAWNIVTSRLGLDQREDEITVAEYNVFLKKIGEAILDPVVEGRRKVWHPLTISFRGPAAHETDKSPNPFLDYRLSVRFDGPDGKRYNVSGFFDGDGKGGASGDMWKVRFTPDKTGQWNYVVSFREGKNIAVDLQPNAGRAGSLDGVSGTFTIEKISSDVPEFLRFGRLEYAGGHYLKFRDGPCW
ncbi:MAG: serine hydrolase, partial [Candidatus Hydrogenedentota bacterium]